MKYKQTYFYRKISNFLFFFKKLFILYLVASQSFINSEIKIFPDHYSSGDVTFEKSEIIQPAAFQTNQQYYYDIGYFSKLTEDYYSQKYGLIYEPEQCQPLTNSGGSITYDSQDKTSFFGSNHPIKNRDSTIEITDVNIFEETKLFENTMTGVNFTCGCPIEFLHNKKSL